MPRRGLQAKRIGVFRHHVTDGGQALTTGLPGAISVPHSRWNKSDLADLTSAGLTPVLVTEDDDWACVTTDDGRYLFLQGHPEYFGNTLFREYRRDVRRFLDRTTDVYPSVPFGYLSPETVAALADFAELAQRRRQPDTFGRFPAIPGEIVGDGPWSEHATVLATNWCGLLAVSHV